MNERDYELLSQYLDNELASPEAQALRRRLLAEPELRAELDRMRRVNDEVVDAFDVPGADRVPPAIAARMGAEQPTAVNVTVLRGGAAALAPAPWKLAIAASLVAAAGVLMVPDWQQAGQMDGFSSQQMLSQALETSSSRADGWDTLEDGRQLRAVLSFASRDGSWCREYLVSEAETTYRGVACRSEGHWNTLVLVQAELPGSSSDFRPAGAGDSDRIASYINTHAKDIPLSIQQEQALIARQWR